MSAFLIRTKGPLDGICPVTFRGNPNVYVEAEYVWGVQFILLNELKEKNLPKMINKNNKKSEFRQ